MTDLIKELCSMSGKLKDFINETQDNVERNTLLSIYFKLNEKIEKLAGQVFDENDDFYLDTVDNIMDTERVIKEFKENQIKLINVFVHLIDIIANVEKILLGWKTGNGK